MPKRNCDDQEEHEDAGHRIAERQPETRKDEPDHVEKCAHRTSIPYLLSGVQKRSEPGDVNGGQTHIVTVVVHEGFARTKGVVDGPTPKSPTWR